MRPKKPYFLFVFYFVISLACNAVTSLPVTEIAPTEAATKAPALVASGDGPQGFSAKVTSADSVLLSWQAVDGATSYHVTVSTNDSRVSTVIDVPSSITKFEDLLAAPNSQLVYGVDAMNDSSSIGRSVASVATPARQPNPLHVLAEIDTAAAVSQKIGTSGGSISMVDAMGVSYELTIPPGALDQDTEISLVPVADLSNWPLDGEMIGVIGIEPEGLVLNEPAILTITPASEISSDGFATVGFSFTGYGEEFALRPIEDSVAGTSYIPEGSAHLARPKAQFMDAVRQFLLELHPAGAGEATPDHAAELVRTNPPSDATAAFDQKEAASLANDDEPTPLPIFPWMRKYNTFHRRIQEVEKCWQLTNAINYLTETRKLADTANDQRQNRLEQDGQAMDELLEKTKDVIDNTSSECTEKKSADSKFTSAPCTLQLIRKLEAGATPIYKEMQTRMLETYGKNVLENGQFNIRNSCKQGYIMSGGTDGMKVNDQVCDISDEFSVHGSVFGGGITLTFTPNSAADGELPGGGAYTYSGSGGGVSLSGEGTFTMLGKLGSDVILKASGPGSAAGYSGSGDENYLLTPIGYACAGG